jgi:hypothetical protein
MLFDNEFCDFVQSKTFGLTPDLSTTRLTLLIPGFLVMVDHIRKLF